MNLFPLPKQKFFDNNGRPLVGGLVFTYEAGTTNKIVTYDDTGAPNTNPIVLDYRGECDIWGDPTLTYKLVLAPANDTDPPTAPIWTVDNIAVPGAGGSGGTPGNPNHSIQFNNGGAFAGSAKLLYDDATTTISFGAVNDTATLIGPTGTGADDGGGVLIAGGDANNGDAGDVRLEAGVSSGGAQGSAFIKVNNVDFIEVTSNGEIKLAGDEGASGQILTSGGTGLPVSWQPVPSTGTSNVVRRAIFIGTQWSTNGSVLGTEVLRLGTDSAPTPIGSGTLGQATMRGRLTSAASLDQTVDFQTSVQSMYRAVSGNSLAAGFAYESEVVFATARVDQQCFIGLAAETNYLMVSTLIVSNLTQCAGFAKDATDTNLQFMYNDASAACTKVDLGIAFTSLLNLLLRCSISVPSGGGNITYTLTNLETGSVIATGVASSNLPSIDQALQCHECANTGAVTGTAVMLDLAARLINTTH